MAKDLSVDILSNTGLYLYWVSKGQYLLVLDGAGSVEGGTGWYLMVLGQ